MMPPAIFQSARFPNRGFSRASYFLMMPADASSVSGCIRPSSGSHIAFTTDCVLSRPPVASATCPGAHSSARRPACCRARTSCARWHATFLLSARPMAPVKRAERKVPGRATSSASESRTFVVSGQNAASVLPGDRSAIPILIPALKMPAFLPAAPCPKRLSHSSTSTLAPPPVRSMQRQARLRLRRLQRH